MTEQHWMPYHKEGFTRRCPTCGEAIYSPVAAPLPPEYRALNERLGLDGASCAWCQADAIREQASPA